MVLILSVIEGNACIERTPLSGFDIATESSRPNQPPICDIPPACLQHLLFPSLARTPCQGFGFLGFIVDLNGASECLRARGAKEIPEPSIYEGKLARFADPDGYHVQLALRKTVFE